MVHNLHIVVGDALSGRIELIYLGTDFAAAHEAFLAASEEFEAARIFDFPQPTRLRYPAQESEDIKRRLEVSQSRDNAEEVARQARLKELRAQHAKVQAELKALGGLPAEPAEPPKPKAEKAPKPKAEKAKQTDL